MIKPFANVDAAINRVTMYRMVIYGLAGTILIGVLLSAVGLVGFSAVGIILSLVVLIAVCYIVNKLFAIVFEAQVNHESWLVTALILTLILPPAQTVIGIAYVALGGIIAIASKYLIAYRHRHIFNPAAVGALVLTITGALPAIWWVGTPLLVIVSVLFGIVMLRKLRRFGFFFAFAATATVVALAVGLSMGQSINALMYGLFLSSPLIFFGTIMLIEPETMPNGTAQKITYAILAGALVSSQLHAGPFYTTPELSLIVANAIAFILSAGRYKRQIRFKGVQSIGNHLREYTFEYDQPFIFKPGQYVELTLPHKNTDSRGNRRTFSISSAPDSTEIRFATKLADVSSSFKKELERIGKGDVITLGQLNGSFVLPKDQSKSFVWIAGGIGITPFVSMARSMIEAKQTRPTILFYLVGSAQEYAFTEVWAAARQYGLTVVPILTSKESDPTWSGLHGSLTTDIIRKYAPDTSAREFYLSGPHGLVEYFKHTLHGLSIRSRSIHTDFFSGY